MLCPCCSGHSYQQCCAEIINMNKVAHSAEALMRSRYSAYALENYQYVLDTYSIKQRQHLSVNELSNSAQGQHWVKLVVHQTNETTVPATVEFSAYYIVNDSLYELREHSRFIQELAHYKYDDGDILINEKITTLSRNDKCPCGSDKKYKKCCAK